MLVLLPFAFLAGIVTILSPCILPVLPIVLSGSTGGKARPYGVVTGFILSFSLFTLVLTAIVKAFALPPDFLRFVAVAFVIGFGLVMIVPALRDRFEMWASRVAGKGASKSGGKPRTGFFGGVVVGTSLGLVWTPCVGPIMASVISLAITQQVDGGAVATVLAYSLGTAIPMFGIMVGGRALIQRLPVLSRNPAAIQRVFGILMIVVGVSIGFGWDRTVQARLLEAFPNWGTGLTAFESIQPVQDALDRRAGGNGEDGGAMNAMAAEPVSFSLANAPKNGRLGDFGMAPEIVTDGMWFNEAGLGIPLPEDGLSMEDLRGKVVVIDFWTYSCINCVRTLPYLRAWWEAYKDDGLVIIGVHTPEFAFERNPENLRKAMADLGVEWPVVQDNDYRQWQAYSNRYWPAKYFIDATGRIRYYHFGEGGYDDSEKVIRALLQEAGQSAGRRADTSRAAAIRANTPETYLGWARAKGFVSTGGAVREEPANYEPAKVPGNGEWSLQGEWTITREYIRPMSSGTLELGFDAKDVFLVIEPAGEGGRIEVMLDGEPAPDNEDVTAGKLMPDESRVYRLVDLPRAGNHLLTLKVDGNLKLYAFTFG